MPKVFHLKFNKEADGAWYIEFPGYPLNHHNLMMVAGAVPPGPSLSTYRFLDSAFGSARNDNLLFGEIKRKPYLCNSF